MPIALLMPALSPTMKEGHLARWHKKEGDPVVAGDLLADIETDKATMEVEAVDEGVLGRILIAAGTENVPINTPIAWILEEGETEKDLPLEVSSSSTPSSLPSHAQENSSSLSSKEEPLKKEEAFFPHSSSSDRLIASPLARRVAQQEGVPLESLRGQGTGPHGRIIREDVDRIIKQQKNPSSVKKVFLPLDGEGLSPYTLIPHTTMRKVIARRLCESKQTVPHFYLSIECVLDKLLEIRQEVNEAFPETKVSVNDFVLRACALALQEVPEANVSWSEQGVRQFQASDVAVAVALEGGLITPILRSAEQKDLRTLSLDMKSLIERARSHKLKPEEFTGGTFSLSNLGMYGVKQFQAVINPPQACILAVGSGEERPVVKDGIIQKATLMNCTLSVDHRVVDGVVGARFLQSFRELIQHPLRLILS